jgi:hypothetical protein
LDGDGSCVQLPKSKPDLEKIASISDLEILSASVGPTLVVFVGAVWNLSPATSLGEIGVGSNGSTVKSTVSSKMDSRDENPWLMLGLEELEPNIVGNTSGLVVLPCNV